MKMVSPECLYLDTILTFRGLSTVFPLRIALGVTEFGISGSLVLIRLRKGMNLMYRDKKNGRLLHRSWKVWLAVTVMLAAIIMYVLTLDDSVVPLLLK